MKKSISWLSFFLGLTLVAAGLLIIWARSRPAVPSAVTAASPRLKVVASIFPLADFVREVGGDKVTVITLLPTGASPHTYEPTPEQVKYIAKADIFVKNGLELEFWAEKVVAAAANPGLVVVETSAGISLPKSESSAGLKEGELKGGTAWKLSDDGEQVLISGVTYSVKALEKAHGLCEGEACNAWSAIRLLVGYEVAIDPEADADHHHAVNPHIWLDPVLAQQQVKNITKALVTADPANREIYRSNEARYLAELEALSDKIKTAVASFSRRDFVSYHPAWTYLAQRYGLVEAAVIEIAPGKEASPAHIKEVVDVVKSLGVKAVFAEPQFNPKAAEAIAAETGSRVLFLDPLGGPELGDRNTYLKLMLYNLGQISQALGK